MERSTKEKSFFFQILSTTSVRKGVEFSIEDLYVDIGAKVLNVINLDGIHQEIE